jgi:hypothetical protein
MKSLIIFVISLLLLSCNEKNNDVNEISILFAPSFHSRTNFRIDIKNSVIEQFSYDDYYLIEEKLDSNTYRTKRKDTLITYYKNKFKINESDLKNFLKILDQVQLDSTLQHREPMIDGISYRISKINKEYDTISLTSNLTIRSKKSEIEYKILDSFFELIYKTIQNYDGYSIAENIQNYFHYELPIRKTNSNPLEYRVWGTISGCRDNNVEFIDFLESLPKRKPVILDLRNGSISYCLNEVLDEYSQKKLIYIYGDKNINNSKKIMNEIELSESKGEKLSELRTQAYNTHKYIYEKLKNNKHNRYFQTRDELLKTVANSGFAKAGD